MAIEEYDNAQLDDEQPLELEQIKTFLSGLIQYPSLLKEALRMGVLPDHFNARGETPFYYLFAAIKNLSAVHGALTAEMVLTEMRAWLTAGRMVVTAEEKEWLFGGGDEPGFVVGIFSRELPDGAAAAAEKSYLQTLMRRFINTRMIETQIQRLSQKTTLTRAEQNISLRDRLQRWAKQAQDVQFIGHQVDNAALMPDFGTPIVLPPPPEPTGLRWIDEYIGGVRSGDLIGLLGPTGGGKSTMMITAAIRMAQNYYLRGENKLSVFICYEDGRDKTSHLFWSAAAHVDRRMFEQPDFWEQFSTRESLKPYDRELPENRNGKIILGERERWEAAQPWVNKHFFSLDFSENAESGSFGSGGVSEIVAVLERLAEERGMEIGFVAIDYAGLLINRELGKSKLTKNMEQVWRPLQILPDEIRVRVAVTFGATVMLAHQMAGAEVQKTPPYKYLTHMNAQGSKAFAENTHACICLNERDRTVNVSTMNYSKVRSRLPSNPLGLIKIDPLVLDVHLVNEQYEACQSARRIVARNEPGFVTPEETMLKKSGRAGAKVDTFSRDFL